MTNHGAEERGLGDRGCHLSWVPFDCTHTPHHPLPICLLIHISPVLSFLSPLNFVLSYLLRCMAVSPFLFPFYCNDLFEHILPSLIFLHPLMHTHTVCLSPIWPQSPPPYILTLTAVQTLKKKKNGFMLLNCFLLRTSSFPLASCVTSELNRIMALGAKQKKAHKCIDKDKMHTSPPLIHTCQKTWGHFSILSCVQLVSDLKWG